ncbi:MAG: hypothetical protein HFH45_03495 [Bacilli bacterium]|nr:hypothetical protein [Bacilli bacterium]
MNLNFNYPIMIFRKDFDNGTVYRMGISKKKQDGSYENGYINCQFKRDVELDNKTKILPSDAWLTFYKTKDGQTVPYVFINQFELVEEEMFELDIDEVLSSEEDEQIDIDDNFLDD